MKKLLLLLTMLVSVGAAKAQNCDFSFQLDTNTNTITLFAPVDDFSPNLYQFFWQLNNNSVYLNGPTVSFTYTTGLVDNIQMNIFQLPPDSNFICTSNQFVVIDGGGNPAGGCTIVANQQDLSTYSFQIPGANYPATWDFGDGTTGSGFQVDHQFTNPGVYTVCANVSGGGFTCNDCIDIVVQGDTTTNPIDPCSADFFASNSPLTGYYMATGNTWSNQTNYSWDFGDGQTGTGPYSYHVYDAPGTYNVCLTATSAFCFENQCQTVVISDVLPVISDSLCNPQFVITQENPFEVLVVNGSTGNDLTFTWTLSGNGVSITAQGAFPEIVVQATGAYTLCLQVSSPICTAIYCDSLLIGETGLLGGRLAASGFTINVVSPQQITGFVTSAKPDENKEASIFPNPFSNSVMISNSTATHYEVYAIDGRLVLNGNLTDGQVVLSTSEFQSGIYLLNLIEKSGARSVSKMIKH